MTSMSEAVTLVRRAENQIVGGFNALHDVTPALSALHAKAWEYAGASPAEAAEHGRAVKAHEHAIREMIEQITQRFRAIDAATKAATTAVDQADAKRKTERSRLKV